MATMTISLPDPMKAWIEEQVGKGEYASASDYVRDAVRRDRQRLSVERPLTEAELIDKLDHSIASGISGRTLSEIFADAEKRVVARQQRIA